MMDPLHSSLFPTQSLSGQETPKKTESSSIASLFHISSYNITQSLKSTWASLTGKKTELYDVKTSVSETLTNMGINKEIIKKSDPQTLAQLMSLIMSNHKLSGKIVEIINKQGSTEFLNEIGKTKVEYQKQILRLVGINPSALGFSLKEEPIKGTNDIQWVYTKDVDLSKPDEYLINSNPPSSEDVDKLFHLIGEQLHVADKISNLIKGEGIAKFFENMALHRQVHKKAELPFEASIYIEKLGSADKRLVNIVNEVMKVLKNIDFTLKPEKDTLYTQGEKAFLITTKGDIIAENIEIGKGAFKNVLNAIKINDWAEHEDTVFLKIKEPIEQKGNTEAEKRIMDKLHGKSPYIAESFQHLEKVKDQDVYVGVQQKLSGKVSETDQPSNITGGDQLRLGSPTDIVKAYAQSSLGLNAMHESNILHLDFKPANFRFDKSGDVRIIDFGLAIELKEGETSVKGLRGTPGYISPEISQKEVLSEAADSYSLGVSMLETAICKYYRCNPEDVFKSFSAQNKNYNDLTNEEFNKGIDNLKKQIDNSKETDSDKKMLNEYIEIAVKLTEKDPNKRLSCADATKEFKKVMNSSCPDVSKQVSWDSRMPETETVSQDETLK